MKYGQQLEHESVPEWSLHNLDYNSLKHEIKVHTARDQATAIAIPGHQDTTLKKFEDGLYDELCRQHDRVDLFVTSKADEVSRRLEHLATKIECVLAKSAGTNDSTKSLKRQRRLARYERELLRCGEEIYAVSRFANAQVVAFRKILKKYKKWTGSTTLSARFNENILGDPKSFTKRTFEHLRSRHDEILSTLLAETPHFSEPSSPESHEHVAPKSASPGQSRHRHVEFEPLPPASTDSPVKYWNEYDDGSEAGEPEEYAIYIDPEEDTGFPGVAYVNAMLSLPYKKAKRWFKSRRGGHENQPLLASEVGSQGSMGYASTVVNTDSEEEGYASSDGYPQLGYATHYALPSISEQKVQRCREHSLVWGTLGCFVVSFALLGIASLLILTGKRKLRVEVDAGVTVGVMISLFCAGSGLGMTLYRRDPLSIPYKLMVSSAFVASCILNGMLLVLVMGNAS
ncbi:spx [Metarhizium album ARSEF 1941]|uniref:Spx n=1 Tax=Metarhizium album (strain ARSEF 1941) TaxID=1081103 RepID=A0A0B2WTJ3_METAS|nr:spx [Metarhizium album ARSEF 1941]KHN96984.1 spx [Metarhizium album ARSEF 1941]